MDQIVQEKIRLTRILTSIGSSDEAVTKRELIDVIKRIDMFLDDYMSGNSYCEADFYLDNNFRSRTGYIQTDRAMMTKEGGLAVKYINDTGSASVKGSLVSASTVVDNAVILQSNEYDTIGAVYEDGVADDSEMWVVVSGRAQVLYKDATASTRANILIADAVNGRASDIANPGGGLPGTDTHFKECGHVLETKTGGTDVLVYCNLHFN